MINGLYLSQFTSIIAFYLNSGWPLSSGDPLEYLASRGPYIRYVNQNQSKVICSVLDDKVFYIFFIFIYLLN